MTSILTTVESPVARLSAARGEPDWLRAWREAAWEAWRSAPLPDRVAHLWRYTDPAQFVPSADALAGCGGAAPAGSGAWPEELAASWERGELAGAAVVAGGRLVRADVSDEARKGGVILEDLHVSASRHADLVRGHLGTAVGPGHGKFEALNAAVWEGGLLLHVPRRVQLRAPIHLLRTFGAGFEASRLLVVAGEGAAVTVVDEAAGGGKDGEPQANAVVEVIAGAGAEVRYVAVQRLGAAAAVHFAQRARVAGGAKFLLAQASLGAAVGKADVGAVLAGRGADALLLGVAVGEGRQHFDHHTVHDHQARDAHSDLHFKVVLRDRARSAYTGLIRIAKDAVNSEAYQENRNLLLNEGTKAESIPELEILTDEVRCTHGATMGPIDPEHVFYLMARGVPREEAVRLIVTGFVEPTLEKMPEDIRRRVRRHVAAKLGIPAETADE